MKEEFLQEHNFNEEFHTEENLGIFLDQKAAQVNEFEKRLAQDLMCVAGEENIIRTVVMAALETEGLDMRKPEIIVESVLANPEIKAEMLNMAENIMRQNLQ